MTNMLVCTANAEDAFTAGAGACDIVEVTMPGPAPHRAVIRAIRAAFAGTLRLRIEGPVRQPGVIEAAVALGADEIALPHEALTDARLALNAMAPLSRPVSLIAIVIAGPEALGILRAAADKADAVVLEAPRGERLIDIASIARIDAFARAARDLGLSFGFAGGLEAPDVARLLVLEPDLLGFDVALRRDHRPELGLDAKAVEAIRALIPHQALARDETAPPSETDHIFVHDFVVLLAIGAYQAERGVRQRVRFSVDADTRRPAEPPADMRGVFSYDIIIETIRVLAERPHVTFVETLAEELAARLLAYPALQAVTIKVEKLDVIEGSVGIVVRRDRANVAKLASYS